MSSSDNILILFYQNMSDLVSERESHTRGWTIRPKLNTWNSFNPNRSAIFSHIGSDNVGDSQGLGDLVEVYWHHATCLLSCELSKILRPASRDSSFSHGRNRSSQPAH